MSGLEVEHLSVDDLSGHMVQGNGIALGSGGLTAGTSSTTAGQAPFFKIPITLAASQTWSIDGNNASGQIGFLDAVTGEGHTLAIKLAHNGGLDIETGGGISPGINAGAITVTGEGQFGGGFVALENTGLNGTDGNPVSFNNASLGFDGASSTGPLTLTGGLVSALGTEPGTLAVKGAVTFDSASTFSSNIKKAGTVAGTDYSQVSATATVKLASAKLILYGATHAEGGGSFICSSLHVGDKDTLLTTTATLEGTFAGVPNGSEVKLNCIGGSGTPATVEITYTANAVIATVLKGGSEGEPTTTTLGASPKSPVTNEGVTLTATVSAASGSPAGNVSFGNHGVAIPGCENVPLSLSKPDTATCHTSFPATSSPEALTATFTPILGSKLAGSSSSTEILVVSRDTTTTALGVSNATPIVGASVTYTATVTASHAGAVGPSGSVEFMDGGVAIGSCSNQALEVGGPSSTATCTLSYTAAAKHRISATYAGDLDFTGSTAAAQEVTVQASNEGGGNGSGGGSTGGNAGGGNTGGGTSSNGGGTGGVLGSKGVSEPMAGQRQTATVSSGTVTVRAKGASTFTPLSASTSIPDGSEIDATNGRVTITVATPNGGTVSAEVYGGRFRVHQDSSGETHFTLTLALTGCPRVGLPKGSAAALAFSAKRSGPKSRHLWVSERGGKWGTNGRFVSTSVEGTTWLTVDECTQSQVKVTAGKVKVHDLVRKKSKTLSGGKQYVAKASARRHK